MYISRYFCARSAQNKMNGHVCLPVGVHVNARSTLVLVLAVGSEPNLILQTKAME